MDPTIALSSLNAALQVVKGWRAAEKAYDAAAFKAQLAEVMEALASAKLALIDSKELVLNLQQENTRLQREFDRSATLKKGDGGYLYEITNDNALTGFPFCPKCLDVDQRLVQLVQNGKILEGKCPRCSESFNPVTCYLAEGGTLKTQDDERRAAESARANKVLEEFGRLNGESSWMAR